MYTVDNRVFTGLKTLSPYGGPGSNPGSGTKLISLQAPG